MTDELRQELEAKPTGELVEILRNQDAEEWRPEVFPFVEAILRERGVNVAAVKEAGPLAEEVVEFAALERVASFSTTMEADLCRMALMEAGIKAWLSTEALAGVIPAMATSGGADVLVRPHNAAAARELLADLNAGAASLPRDPG